MPLQPVDTGFDSPHSSDERFFTPRRTPREGNYLSSGDEWSKNSGRGYGSNSESDHYETPRHGYTSDMSDGSQKSESYHHCSAQGGADYYTTPFVANGGGGHAPPLRRSAAPQMARKRQNARPIPTAWAAEQTNSYSSDDSGYASQEYTHGSGSYDKDYHCNSAEHHSYPTIAEHPHQDYAHEQGYGEEQAWREHAPGSSWSSQEWGGSQYQYAADPAVVQASASYEGQIDELYSLARHNRVQEVQQYLESGFPVNSRDKNGNTLLSIACQNGNKRVAKAALRQGADINSQNDKGNSPLHFCFSYGFGESLGAYLISKGADTTVRNRAGLTCYEGIAHVTHAPHAHTHAHAHAHGQQCY